jgi:hypothetical protein
MRPFRRQLRIVNVAISASRILVTSVPLCIIAFVASILTRVAVWGVTSILFDSAAAFHLWIVRHSLHNTAALLHSGIQIFRIHGVKPTLDVSNPSVQAHCPLRILSHNGIYPLLPLLLVKLLPSGRVKAMEGQQPLPSVNSAEKWRTIIRRQRALLIFRRSVLKPQSLTLSYRCGFVGSSFILECALRLRNTLNIARS